MMNVFVLDLHFKCYHPEVPYISTEMKLDTKESRVYMLRDHYINQPENDEILLSLRSKNLEEKERIRLNLSSGIAEYRQGVGKEAKCNLKTGDIDLLPDSGLTKNDVKTGIDELYNCCNALEERYNSSVDSQYFSDELKQDINDLLSKFKENKS